MADNPGKGTRVSGSAREALASELAEKYRDGASIRDLAAEVGRSYGFVHRVLLEHGVTMRGRGGSAPRRSTS